ncbi:GNAT family N-acetyltransferase [Kitasatospora purpeofusca]|uniref:GNAT family N-acetyltransferase n=1 Tax=Kitasatospora purpeofusca TaxID=67352 RepID=UPI003869230D|nr:GNAT family N-acetyltransferase [Kitasatospora purpeofusca]
MIGLRELTLDDAEAIRRVYGPESVKFLGRAPMDAVEVRSYLADALVSAARSPRTLHTLGLTVDYDLLGVVKLRLERPVAAVSYILRADAWGRGHATEGLRRIVALGVGELGLAEIRARHHVDNPASGRVLLRAGFTRTGARAGFMDYVIRPPSPPAR